MERNNICESIIFNLYAINLLRVHERSRKVGLSTQGPLKLGITWHIEHTEGMGSINIQ